MQSLFDYLTTNPVVYVSRDIERTFGLPLSTEGYYSISNNSLLAKSGMRGSNAAFIPKTETTQNTRELLLDPSVAQIIGTIENASLLVFKNNGQIERICNKQSWHLLNPSATIATAAEEKISQVDWLGELASFLPPHSIQITSEIKWKDEPFMLQFNHAHTGVGTALIESQQDLTSMQEVFPKRPARCSEFIPGPVFTNNNVVTPTTTLAGNISYQITGLAPFTDNHFATIGNDWALPHTLLSADQKKQYHNMVQAIGDRLRADGWKGLFGIDVIADERTGTLYLLEINARQPASTAYESELQEQQRAQGTTGITTFEAHLAALLDLPISETLIPLAQGAQIIQRVTRYKKKIEEPMIDHATAQGFSVLPIGHTKIGKELLIFRSANGIMADHNLLNDTGKRLL